MPEKNARLTLRMSPVTSNRQPEQYISLVVHDAVSGQRIVQFELLGQDVLDLFSNRQVGGVDGLEAWVIEPELRHTINRMHGTTTRRFPTSKFEESAVALWCSQNCSALGGTSWRVTQNNASMHVVHWDYYVDVRTQPELDAVMQVRQDTMDVLPEPRHKA
jgi:hypothetical protein